MYYTYISKGDCNDTNNYRGITLIICMGKLFTSVLNAILLQWDNENKIHVITDAQFGFRPGHSTVDAIFILQTLINKYLNKREGGYTVASLTTEKRLILLTGEDCGVK